MSAPLAFSPLAAATSELLAHEIDHLDGVLAVDRAMDREALVLREVFEARRAAFEGRVDPREDRQLDVGRGDHRERGFS